MMNAKPYTCLDCGLVGEQARRGRGRLRCDDCRKAYMQDHHAGRLVRMCPGCGTVCEQGNGRTYCSLECRPPDQRMTYTEKKALRTPAVCEGCGVEYAPSHRRQRWCSRTCGNRYKPMSLAGPRFTPEEARERIRESWRQKNRRRRAAKRGALSEPYTLAEIAARDKLRCKLCGKRVAMRQTAPHPKSPTIDHILPLFDGGDDTRANVQLAHFLCNSAKGPRGSQQLALIG